MKWFLMVMICSAIVKAKSTFIGTVSVSNRVSAAETDAKKINVYESIEQTILTGNKSVVCKSAVLPAFVGAHGNHPAGIVLRCSEKNSKIYYMIDVDCAPDKTESFSFNWKNNKIETTTTLTVSCTEFNEKI